VTRAYLRAVDEALPGLVETLYVVGSAALGARTPDASDVDTVIVTPRTPDDRDLAALAAWCDLGPARLHTLAHGDVIAKAAAATYLGRLFPQRGPLADRAVRWRAGHAETFTATDLRAAGHSIDTVVEDAWNRWAE
jgi:hypothetical protein